MSVKVYPLNAVMSLRHRDREDEVVRVEAEMSNVASGLRLRRGPLWIHVCYGGRSGHPFVPPLPEQPVSRAAASPCQLQCLSLFQSLHCRILLLLLTFQCSPTSLRPANAIAALSWLFMATEATECLDSTGLVSPRCPALASGPR